MSKQKTNDGGPAFPTEKLQNSMTMHTILRGGMSLRDYFAAKAMGEVMRTWEKSRDNDGSTFTFDCSLMAEDCYTMADAMIEARKGGANE